MSYNTYPNPYQKHLTSEEVLQKRLENIDRNWQRYVKVALVFHLLLLVFVFTMIVTVRFAFLIF
ncbi:hypothetical protein IPJ72_04175 [Candidatus Peregrinibacteria bacterium]|nr:MAG: hypothetical protein IPJ72_04175 [Candidatus Peregrinibacteria bacterium]